MADLPTIICIGRVYCDVIFTDLARMPTPGTEVFAGGLGIHAGGGATITAGHLSALGHPTHLAAFLPGDGFGQEISRELGSLGVDMSLCQKRAAGTPPQMTVAMVQGEERAFVSHRVGAAFPALGAEDLRKVNPAHIHVGEASTLIDHPEIIDLTKALGATLSLDCSWDDDLDASAITRLLPEIDVFLPNEAEVELLRDIGVTDLTAKLTVTKQGKDGASALINGRDYHAPAIPVDVVDTTGAGDAFNAAFLSVWLKGEPIETCLEFGNRKGAETVGGRGGLTALLAQ